MMLDLSIDRQQLFCNLLDFISDVIMINSIMTMFLCKLSFNSSLSRQVLLVCGLSCTFSLCQCSVSNSCCFSLMAIESTDYGVSYFGCDSNFFSQVSFKVLLILVLLLSHLFCCGESCGKCFFSLCSLSVPIVCVTFSLGSGNSSSTGLCIIVLLVFNSVEFGL